MAYSKTMHNLTSLALTLLFIVTPNLSHAQIENTDVQVLGTLYCSTTGNPDPACGGVQCPPLSEALVTLSCDSQTTPIGEAVTNTTGSYEILLNAAQRLILLRAANRPLSDEPACGVSVKLPVASCDALPPNGNIESFFILNDIVRVAVRSLPGNMLMINSNWGYNQHF